MITSIYVLSSKENKNSAREYASWLIENMAMLPETKGHRFVLRANIFSLIFRRKNSIAIIYDISHDFFPEIHSKFYKNYLRFITRCALHLTQKIIVPSESAKKDILKFYPPKEQTNLEKIFVMYCVAGYGLSYEKTLGFSQRAPHLDGRKLCINDIPLSLYSINKPSGGREKPHSVSALARSAPVFKKLERNSVPTRTSNVFLGDNSYPTCSLDNPYFLYIGRLELKKNILGILRAFDLFKAQYKSPYKLVLAGELGFDGNKIKEVAAKCNFKNDIILIDSLDDEKTDSLFKNADIFFYPSFYESSGGTILKAQFYGLPVITSCVSSMPEIAGQGAMLISPHDIEEMKEAMIRVAADKNLREYLSQKSYENLKRFRPYTKQIFNIRPIAIK